MVAATDVFELLEQTEYAGEIVRASESVLVRVCEHDESSEAELELWRNRGVQKFLCPVTRLF